MLMSRARTAVERAATAAESVVVMRGAVQTSTARTAVEGAVMAAKSVVGMRSEVLTSAATIIEERAATVKSVAVMLSVVVLLGVAVLVVVAATNLAATLPPHWPMQMPAQCRTQANLVAALLAAQREIELGKTVSGVGQATAAATGGGAEEGMVRRAVLFFRSARVDHPGGDPCSDDLHITAS